jgi:hypothetical protein
LRSTRALGIPEVKVNWHTFKWPNAMNDGGHHEAGETSMPIGAAGETVDHGAASSVRRRAIDAP